MPLTVIERRAAAVGRSRALLRRELLSARSLLQPELQRRFRQQRFDLDNWRLLSDDGQLALEWRLRLRPDQPVAGNNQQTAVGTVVCIDLAKDVICEPHCVHSGR